MKVTTPAYGEIELSTLEAALYEAVASHTDVEATAEEIAVALTGLHGVPSDGFFAAFDFEVAELRTRFLGMKR